MILYGKKMTNKQAIHQVNNYFTTLRRVNDSEIVKAAAAIALIIGVIWGLIEVLEMVNGCQL